MVGCPLCVGDGCWGGLRSAPLEVQQSIVAEIEGYQRVQSKAREVIENMDAEIEAAIGRV